METSALTFAEPLWFFALIAVPLVAVLYFWSQRRSDALIAKIVAPRLRSQLAGAVSRGMRFFKAVLIILSIIFLVIALARPQKGFITQETKEEGRDVIIAVDTSRSMLATDVAPTRLTRAKLVAQDLLDLIHGDRSGLIAFAGSAFLQAPLTLDRGAVLTSLDELDTTIIPKGGTNIAEAIRLAEKAFGKGEGQSRALVILTDGEELDADGIAAARKAAEQGIRIFTVGIGSAEGSLIPLQGGRSGAEFVRDESGKPVNSRLDENRLKEIAAAGGGFYVPLGPDAARQIFEEGIKPMEREEKDMTSARQPIERYQWPLGISMALLALWLILGDRRRSFGVGASVAKAAAALLVLFLLSPSAFADALQQYQAGNYKEALEEYNVRLQKQPSSAELQYNAGTAAYKTGDYAKAVESFGKALESPESAKLRSETVYNLANALVRRGESVQSSEEKKSDWKNAIQHYSEVLNTDPKNKQAEENREIVTKLLEDLEKQEQQQKQDQNDQKDQKQDQKNQQQDQKNQQQDQKNQKQDQKDQQQDQKDQQQDQKDQQQDQKDQQQDQKDQQQDQKDQQQDQKDQQQDQKDQRQDQKDQQQDQKDQQQDQKDQQQNQKDQQQSRPQNQSPQEDRQEPAPAPTPGEKKEGDLKANDPQQDSAQEQQAEELAEAEEKEGEMSPAQARALLNSLRNEEERVRLMRRSTQQETTKDW